jgi:hypothetical protein
MFSLGIAQSAMKISVFQLLTTARPLAEGSAKALLLAALSQPYYSLLLH